jgi:DNA-binding CsgD family transcriptional regulator
MTWRCASTQHRKDTTGGCVSDEPTKKRVRRAKIEVPESAPPVLAQMASLVPTQRRTHDVQSLYVMGYAQTEIARRLGIAPATVASEIARAREMMRARFAGITPVEIAAQFASAYEQVQRMAMDAADAADGTREAIAAANCAINALKAKAAVLEACGVIHKDPVRTPEEAQMAEDARKLTEHQKRVVSELLLRRLVPEVLERAEGRVEQVEPVPSEMVNVDVAPIEPDMPPAVDAAETGEQPMPLHAPEPPAPPIAVDDRNKESW